MKTLGTEFKVGLFTLVAASTIGYMFFVLSPDTFERNSQVVYHTILDDAAGVIPKTHVKTNGVTIGKVKSVVLETNKTRIDIEIDATVKIPLGSQVEIRTRGLLGDVFIEIVRVPDNGNYVKPGELIPLSDSQVDLQQLMVIAGSIAKDIKQVTDSLAKVAGGKEGEQSLRDIVDNIKGITKETKELLAENRKDIRSTISSLEKTSRLLGDAISQDGNDLALIVANVKQSSKDLAEFSSSIRELVTGENRDKLDSIIAKFDTTMQDVEDTAKNVKLVSDKIERGEGTIGRLVNDEKTIAELEGALKDIREVLAPASKLQIEIDYHGELRKDETTQNYFNMVFRTRPDKFYLLGFTDHTAKEVETVTEETDLPDQDGVSKRSEKQTITTQNAIRFNLQFAKRWHWYQVRFGLFESTGGIASDFFAVRDRLKLSVEAFNWDSESPLRETAHLKTYVSVLFFNHIYAMVGVDDITRKNQDTGKVNEEPNYFFGAGLTFNDQDLKSIFGAAALAL
jgi:phospholipid/cholesterol/gamma-HCH transport system substrate-binding protein